VTVNGSKANGVLLFTNVTNSTGWSERQTILEYTHLAGGVTNYSSTWFNATYGGYENNSVTDISENHIGASAIRRAINVSVTTVDCGTISTPNTIVTLTQSVSSTGTCFTVTADNVTLDCNGFGINYSSTSAGYGVQSNSTNTTVKNCAMNQTNATILLAHAVYFNGASAGNGTIFNNSITARNNSYGVYLTSSSYSNISNNTIVAGTATGAGGIYVPTTGNVINQNNITVSGTACRGIFMTTAASSNNITGNIISTTGAGSDSLIAEGSNEYIFNNTMIASSTSGTASDNVYVYLLTSSNFSYNNFTVATCSGGSCRAIYSIGATGNSFIGNSFTTVGSSSYALYLVNSTSNFTNSVINATTDGVSDIYFSGYGVNNFTNCTFNKSKISYAVDSNASANVFWYADVHTVNSTGSDLGSANVNVSNINGTSIVNLTTNSTGWLAQQTIQEYMQNATSVYNATPHQFNSTKSGYTQNNSVFTVDSSKIITIALTTSVSPVTDVGYCGSLSIAGTYYALNTSITNTGTCFTVTADNITLDCGYYAQYVLTGTGSGSGIDTSSRFNTTIKNCSITNFGTGISSTSSTWGTYSYNHVYTNTGHGIGFVSSKNNTFSYNNITNHHTTTNIHLYACKDNNITYNSLSYGANNLYFTGEGTVSSGNYVAFNNISYQTSHGHGDIYCAYGSANNTFANNFWFNATNKAIDIAGVGTGNVVINNVFEQHIGSQVMYIHAPNTSIINNTINMDAYIGGIQLVNDGTNFANNSLVANNTISVGLAGTGISISGVTNAVISGNNITIPSSSTYSTAGIWVYDTTYAYRQHNIDTTNLINGLPVKYYDGVYTPCPNNTNLNLGSTYSYIGFLGCDNVTLNGSTTIQNIVVYHSSNMTVSNCNSSYNMYGVIYINSTNGVIVNNTFNNNLPLYFYGGGHGLYIRGSDNSIISGNTISNNTYQGIWGATANNNLTITNNVVNDNGGTSISLSTGANYSISGNNVSTSISGASGISASSITNFNLSNNNVLTNSSNALSLSGVSVAVISDGAFSASYAGVADIYMADTSTANFTNVTFNKGDTSFAAGATGSINVFWNAYVHTIYANGTDFASVTVNETNVNGTSLFNGTTNSTGWLAPQVIQEYSQTLAGGIVNYTPHWINASFTGYGSNNTQTSITSSQTITRALTEATTYPQYSSRAINFSNGSQYDPNTAAQASITWSSEDTVIFNWNGVNHTITAPYQYYLGVLSVGSYSNYWCANSSTGNWNCTTTETFTIVQNTSGVCRLALNGTQGNVSYSFGQTSNATGWLVISEGSSALTLNGSSVANPLIVNLGAGYWLLNYSKAATQNYSACNVERFATVTQISSDANLLLNGTDANVSMFVGQTSNATGYCAGGEFMLYRDGNPRETNPEIANLAVGNYNYTVFCFTNQNYSASSEMHYLNIIALTGDLMVILNSPANATFNNSRNISFFYTPVSNVSLTNATLYSNFNGTWTSNQTNSSEMFNDSLNDIAVDGVPEAGFFLWNIYVCDIATCSFASANLTLTTDYTPPTADWASSMGANNTLTGNDYIFWNATFVETWWYDCQFEVNGTNHSGTPNSLTSPTYCYYNATGLTNASTYRAQAWIVDAAGNSNETTELDYTLNLSATPTPTPVPPGGGGGGGGSTPTHSPSPSISPTPTIGGCAPAGTGCNLFTGKAVTGQDCCSGGCAIVGFSYQCRAASPSPSPSSSPRASPTPTPKFGATPTPTPFVLIPTVTQKFELKDFALWAVVFVLLVVALLYFRRKYNRQRKAFSTGRTTFKVKAMLVILGLAAFVALVALAYMLWASWAG
jgi:parallel beta-helix repeat protein